MSLLASWLAEWLDGSLRGRPLNQLAATDSGQLIRLSYSALSSLELNSELRAEPIRNSSKTEPKTKPNWQTTCEH